MCTEKAFYYDFEQQDLELDCDLESVRPILLRSILGTPPWLRILFNITFDKCRNASSTLKLDFAEVSINHIPFSFAT